MVGPKKPFVVKMPDGGWVWPKALRDGLIKVPSSRKATNISMKVDPLEIKWF